MEPPESVFHSRLLMIENDILDLAVRSFILTYFVVIGSAHSTTKRSDVEEFSEEKPGRPHDCHCASKLPSIYFAPLINLFPLNLKHLMREYV